MIKISILYLVNGGLQSETYIVQSHEFIGKNDHIYKLNISNSHIVYIPVRNIQKIDVQTV